MNNVIEIVNIDGTKEDVSLITYLNSEDNKRQYLVYSRNENIGNNGDLLIYVAKIMSENDELTLKAIVDDAEWIDIQHMLKKIANAVN